MTAASNGPTAPWKLTVTPPPAPPAPVLPAPPVGARRPGAAERAAGADGDRLRDAGPVDHRTGREARRGDARQLREQPVGPGRQRRRRVDGDDPRELRRVARVEDLDVRLQRRRAARGILGDREDDVLAVLRDGQRRERIGRARVAEQAAAGARVAVRGDERQARDREQRRPSSRGSTCRLLGFSWELPSWSRPAVTDRRRGSSGCGCRRCRPRPAGRSRRPHGLSSSAAAAGPSSPENPAGRSWPANVAMIPSGVTTRTQSLSVSAMKMRPSARDRDVGEPAELRGRGGTAVAGEAPRAGAREGRDDAGRVDAPQAEVLGVGDVDVAVGRRARSARPAGPPGRSGSETRPRSRARRR